MKNSFNWPHKEIALVLPRAHLRLVFLRNGVGRVENGACPRKTVVSYSYICQNLIYNFLFHLQFDMEI